MPDITILTERELRDCVTLDKSAVDVVEAAFRALAEGGVIMPPILLMTIEAKNGEVDAKTAYILGLDGFAIKVSPASSTIRSKVCRASTGYWSCSAPRPGSSNRFCSTMAI